MKVMPGKLLILITIFSILLVGITFFLNRNVSAQYPTLYNVGITVFLDNNCNGVQDPFIDNGQSGYTITINPGGLSKVTPFNGFQSFDLVAGSYTATMSPAVPTVGPNPAPFSLGPANPSASVVFAIKPSGGCLTPPSVTCSSSPNPAVINQTVTWTAFPSGGTGTYTSYSWSGSASGSSNPANPTSFPGPGTYTAGVTVTDSAGGTASTTCPVTVNPPPPPLPDLIIRTLGFLPVNALVGTPMTFNARVSNQGTANVTIATNTSFNLDVNNNASAADDPPPWLISTPPLNAGATSPTLTTSSWTAVAGTHRLTVCADVGPPVGGAVAESNESNNCASIIFTISTSTPPLIVSCSVSPTTAFIGENVTWTANRAGGTGVYTYSWSGTDGLTGITQQVTRSYATAGVKTASVTVTSGSQSVIGNCNTNFNSVVVSAGSPAWIQTTGGDVHSNTRINTPGGP